MKYVRSTAQFPDPVSVGARDWGEETLLATSSGNFTLKNFSLKLVQRVDCNTIERKMNVDMLFRVA